MKKVVLLMSMGGPERLEDVQIFLFHLFKDPHILRLPALFRVPLAFFLSLWRAGKAKNIYKKMGGKSPLLQQTQKQARALEAVLGEDYFCVVGMSYAAPFIAEAVKDIERRGIKDILLLPLYPQFSTTTSQSVLDEAQKEIRKRIKGANIEIRSSFPVLDGFIETMGAALQKEYAQARAFGKPITLFSAHGLPEKIVQGGDPYPKECAQTVRALVEKEGLEKTDYILCYQSRVGPFPWIKPFTDEQIDVAAKAGRPIIIVPISFVSEHSETLVELDQDYRKRATEGGAPFFSRIATVQETPRFIEALADLVRLR
jgi:ferrochelatase